MFSRIFGGKATDADAAAPEAAAGAATTQVVSSATTQAVSSATRQVVSSATTQVVSSAAAPASSQEHTTPVTEASTSQATAPVAAQVEAPVKHTVVRQTVVKQTVSLSGGAPYMAQYSSAEAPAPVEYAPATYTTVAANTSIADESTILQGNTTYEHSSVSYQPNELETSMREQSTVVVQPLYTMQSLDKTISSAVPIYSRHDLGQVGAMPQIVRVAMPMKGETLQSDQLAKVFPLGAPDHLVRSASLDSPNREGQASGSVSVAPCSPVVTKYPLAAMKQSPPVVLTNGVSLSISPQKPEPQEAAAAPKPELELPKKAEAGKKSSKSSTKKKVVVKKKSNKGVCPC